MHTRPGQLKGKIAFMSRRGRSADSIDSRSDLFSCGAMLWSAHRAPPVGRHSDRRPRHLQRVPPASSIGLAARVAGCGLVRALARDREDRHQSASRWRSICATRPRRPPALGAPRWPPVGRVRRSARAPRSRTIAPRDPSIRSPRPTAFAPALGCGYASIRIGTPTQRAQHPASPNSERTEPEVPWRWTPWAGGLGKAKVIALGRSARAGGAARGVPRQLRDRCPRASAAAAEQPTATAKATAEATPRPRPADGRADGFERSGEEERHPGPYGAATHRPSSGYRRGRPPPAPPKPARSPTSAEGAETALWDKSATPWPEP